MAQSHKRSLLIALVALAPAFTACEQVDEISSVAETTRPAQPINAVNAKPKFATLVWRDSTSSVPKRVAYVWVDGPKKAARLQIGKYALDIPRGAVSQPTVFRMQVVDDGFITAELDAYVWNNGWQQVHTFNQPLKLTLPYDEAASDIVADPTKLLIANTLNAEILELVNTSVDWRHLTVTGEITHFSMWALAKEISMGID
jgi:hypothetical protein